MADSGSTMLRWQAGQETLGAIVAAHRPSCSLNLRERPAQFGQSIRLPVRASTEIGSPSPQSGHRTVAPIVQIPRSRWSRPRSNPITTSSPTRITGTAMRPVRLTSSARAVSSSAMFLDSNGMPFRERNSFATWHDCQVLDQ